MSRAATFRSSSENRSQRNASSTTGLGSFIDDPPFPQRCVEHTSHNAATPRNFIRRGDHDVFADGKVAQ